MKIESKYDGEELQKSVRKADETRANSCSPDPHSDCSISPRTDDSDSPKFEHSVDTGFTAFRPWTVGEDSAPEMQSKCGR